MRKVLAGLLAMAGGLLGAAPLASADVVTPRSALAFRDSVGVNTHASYFDTAYANWPRLVARLDELGVRHLRDGVYAYPEPAWRDWNERYYHAVELAAAHGMRFDFIMSPPRNNSGTLDQLLGVVESRLRPAAEALEAPNELDKYVGGSRWPLLLGAYGRDLHRKVKGRASLRPLPIVGPSLGTPEGPRMAGDQRSWMDVGNIHPYTGGESPTPEHLQSEFADASRVSGRKPVWATEVGFHNALDASRDQQPPVTETAGATYLLRTFLEHFDSGIDRTYAYELIDEKPESRQRDQEQHFGLLRNDYKPKPAFTALKNLLALVGRDDRRPRLRPLRLEISGRADVVRRLVLQKADGTYLVALWRLASVLDPERDRPLRVAPRAVELRIPGAGRVAAADPVVSAGTHPLRLRRGRVRVELGARPLVLHVTPARLFSARRP